MRAVFWPLCLAVTLTSLLAFQRPFRQYPGVEYDIFPLPADYREPAEFVFARLMYPPTRRGIGGGYGFRGNGDWREGSSIWTQDYPRADRHFAEAVRRLTRLHIRSVEQPVNLDDGDDAFNYPWLYAVQVGQWRLTDEQVKKFREYFARGGFFMCDDFWGEAQWENFLYSMQRVLPGRPVVDIPDDDPVMRVVYDLRDRYQVPGARYMSTGVTWKCQGCPARWRGIYDDQGRLVVAMSYNSDLGDSWEWADDARYDEKFSALSIRIGINYIVYAMTH
ncbi:MAG TPA: DUF4159 domain-containing protein [Bryobacteraceae bacterium]|jgi:hypothetical protein|nr:DUF4159 domain-containing protein [Bryobacteraceae bacterium]